PEPPARVPARAPLRRDRADLGRAQREPPAVEGLPERGRDPAFAVPAELDDHGFESRELERRLEAALAPARVKDDVRVAGRFGRRGELDAERRRDLGLARVDVDELDARAGNSRDEPGDEASDRAC